MGFRRSIAFTILIAASAPITTALAAPPASPAKAASSSTTPASGATASAKPTHTAPTASTAKAASGSAAPASKPTASAKPAKPANPEKAAEAAFEKLKAVPTKPGDAKVGKAKAVACGACHGVTGNSTNPMYPKLAAQNSRYIVTQLMRFKSGVRKNAIMSGMASTLSPQDMRDIAAYFSQQKRTPGVADEKLASKGEKLYREGDASRGIPACMACHGPDGAGNPGWRVPNIAGQHAQYVRKTLQAWHNGGSWGTDTHATIMPTIARRLTEQDITAVSSYVQGLHAVPVSRPTNRQDTVD